MRCENAWNIEHFSIQLSLSKCIAEHLYMLVLSFSKKLFVVSALNYKNLCNSGNIFCVEIESLFNLIVLNKSHSTTTNII